MKVISCGFVSTAHNPLRAAETIATLDNMLRGRFAFGLVRGYQYRWVENFKVRPGLAAVGPWNKNSPADDANRAYFAEFIEVVLKALTQETFSHDGEYWQFPARGMVNPHPHTVYTEFGRGVNDDMSIDAVGIAPRPYQQPYPQLYAGFGASLRTALFWARHRGRPVVMSSNLDFCDMLWSRYREEALRWGHEVAPGSEAAWGGIMICAPTDSEAMRQFETCAGSGIPGACLSAIRCPRPWSAARTPSRASSKPRARVSIRAKPSSSCRRASTAPGRCVILSACSPRR